MTKPQVGMTLVDHHGRKNLTGDERQRFLAAVRTHRRPTVQTLASTLALTGCRISEALGLRAGDVDCPAAELRIRTLNCRWRPALMVRLYLFAEGQSEQTFANTMLSPHLAQYGVYLHGAVPVADSHKKHNEPSTQIRQ